MDSDPALARSTAKPPVKRRRRFTLTAPVVREPLLHRQIADVLAREIAPPGQISRHHVTWWSVDMATYGGNAPGLRTARGCIAGVPDIIVLYQGRANFVEVKALDGEVSLAQQSVATTILVNGATYGVACNAAETLALLDIWGVPRSKRTRL